MRESRAGGILYELASFLLPLLLFVALWEIFAHTGLVKPILLPPPSKILKRLLIEAGKGAGEIGLADHLLNSLYRLVIGFSTGAMVGALSGLGMGMNRWIYGYLNPVITVLMPVPGITWTPILVLVLGFGDPTLITVTFIASFFPVAYNTAAGVRSVKRDHIWAGKIMGVDRMGTVFKILIPSSAPYIITGLKLGLARGWRTLIACEMIAAALTGIGFWIFDAKEYLKTDVIYGGIIVMAMVFVIIDRIGFGYLERQTIEKWGMSADIG